MGLGPISRGLLRGGVGTARLAIEAAISGPAIFGARSLAELPGRTERSKRFQENLTFPLDLLKQGSTNNPYFMSIRFVKYQKRAISERKVIQEQKRIFLPIPNQLNDTTSLAYDQQPLGSMIGAFTEAATGTQNVGATIAEGLAVEGLQRLLGSVKIGDKLGNAVSAISGLAINPFLTVIFKNPTFKSHRFSWKFYPKTQEESIALTNIVQIIKYHMLPGLLTTSGVIFEYPEMVLIDIFPTDKHLYKFKPCIIKDLNISTTN